MMDLPNYSGQLLQQLWALRKDGRFCDCTILVGDRPHQAHKLLLAASSMLFRSLLDGSDTISIDTAVVSSQEFGCLLDMVYTGRLPLGKHNVSRIIAAADNLQMFDVAVGFKNVLTGLVNQQPPSSVVSTQTPNHKGQSPGPEGSASSDAKEQNAEPQKDDGQRDGGEAKEQVSPSAGAEEAKPSETSGQENDSCATTSTASGQPAAGLEGLSQLVEMFTNISSVQELLRRAAQSHLEEQERRVVWQCCEEPQPKLALEKLMSCANEGELSQEVIVRLLRSVQQTLSKSIIPPSLLSTMEEEDEEEEEGGGKPTEEPTATESEQPSREEEEEEGEEEGGVETMEEETTNNEEDVTKKQSSPSPSSPSTPFSCRFCKKGFAYKCRMLAHVKRCPVSSQQQQQHHRAEAHRNHTGAKKKVSCDLCARAFAHPSGLIYHKRTEHFEEKPFSCHDCGAKFGANSSLKNHMRLHTGEKPYQCKHCAMSFSVAAALAYHTKRKHSEGKMYVCQYCKASFAQSIELTRHVRTHTGDRPYVCRECGKGYSQASGLTAHLHTFHNLSEPHDCPKCCLSFPTLEEHQQHIQQFHPKEFHRCPTCSKVFTSAALLDKHKAAHAGAKPFRCDLCNKSYQQVSGLWYHNRTHHPDVYANNHHHQSRQLKSLVQCDLCFKFFPGAASVAKHREAEHQGSSAAAALPCSHCPAGFADEAELQDHISAQHLGTQHGGGSSQSSNQSSNQSSSSSSGLSCQLCSLVCPSQLELQHHLVSSHLGTVGILESGKKSPPPHTVIQTDPAGVSEAQSVPPEEQAQLEAAQQVLLSLAGGREGGSSAEVLEVNVFDLLNNTVAFICEDKESAPQVEP